MRFLVEYFTSFVVFSKTNKPFGSEEVSVHRKVLLDEIETVSVTRWIKSDRLITRSSCTFHSNGTIEDSSASLHCDFANAYLGGGVLQGGNVQEEILFLCKP